MKEQNMTTKHTPGKYIVTGPAGTGWQIIAEMPPPVGLTPLYEVIAKPTITFGDDGQLHVLVAYETYYQFHSTDFRKTQGETAKLFAASPELLEACKAALQVISEQADIHHTTRAGMAHQQLVYAIAKAEGQQ